MKQTSELGLGLISGMLYYNARKQIMLTGRI